MTPIEEFFKTVLNINIWLGAKFVYLFILVLYCVFALMVVRETELMNRTLKGVFNLPIKVIALVHFIFSVFILILSFFVL